MSSRSSLSLAQKLLWRDFRSGELNVLVVALLVSVTTVTGIGLFSDRIQNSIFDEASSLLAADAQIAGSQPIPEEWVASAKDQNLETAFLTGFQAMAFGNSNAMQLASVKAASSEYPLKGELEISDKPFGTAQKIATGPEPGEAWVSSRLMASLRLEQGDKIGIGNTDLTVTQALISEPDNAGSGFDLSPRVLINQQDIDATGAVQLGSRVRHRLLLAGDVEPYHQQWKALETPHHRWRSVESANERITDTLERATSFLLLAGALGVVLAGVALSLASRRYASRQRAHVALLKTLGLSPSDIARIYTVNLLMLSVIVVSVGLFIGWFLHWAFLALLADLLPRALEAASMKPYVIGLTTGVVCLLAFALPPIWALRHTPPAKVLRNDLTGGTVSRRNTSIIGLLAVCGLVFLYAQDVLITGALIVAGGVAALGVTLFARLMILLTRKLGSGLGVTWRLGLASLQRHGEQNSFQIMIFTIVLMLLFILSLLRTSLLTEWQNQLPEGTPNHFAFNLFENERADFENLLAVNSVASTPLYPMMRGRLTQVNSEPIQDRLERLDPEGDDYRRELNNTWSGELASDNEVVEGEWFDQADQEQLLISIEQEFAENLEITIGDELTFSFGGQDVTAPVDNIRTVQWDSLTPNFYIIFSSPVLEGRGAAYLTSFYLSDDQKPFLVQLLQQHPTITVIEVDLILKQIQSIIEQVTFAVEFILMLVLIAGFIVLVASIQATLDDRLQESAILRTLGAKGKTVQGALAIEFVALGALAGLLAALCAEIGLYFLQVELLRMDFSPAPLLFLVGPFVGAFTIAIVGLTSTRRVVKETPLNVLRSL